MIMKLILPQAKLLGKICLKAVRDTFCQYVACNQERDGVRHKKYPEKGAWSEYCNNFEKSEREYIFFQSNKFTAFKVRDGKEVTKSLTVFNLRKISHLFQNKKYLST